MDVQHPVQVLNANKDKSVPVSAQALTTTLQDVPTTWQAIMRDMQEMNVSAQAQITMIQRCIEQHRLLLEMYEQDAKRLEMQTHNCMLAR
jgi:hypothetical protein